jgi:hypothetical protein
VLEFSKTNSFSEIMSYLPDMSLRENDTNDPTDTSLVNASLSVAPAAIGCAVGLLIADKLKSESRTNLASTLLTLGALAALPWAMSYADKALNNPTRERASKRRLRSIREGGTEIEIVGGDDYFLDQYQG